MFEFSDVIARDSAFTPAVTPSLTKGSGVLTECREKGSTYGPMAAFTKGHGLQTADLGKAPNVCQMVLSIKVAS